MRPTKHRRRFHTDRIVKNRRARYLRESHWPRDLYMENMRRFGYGALADRDPWDCGSTCFMCHWAKFNEPRRAREAREWRRDWGV